MEGYKINISCIRTTKRKSYEVKSLKTTSVDVCRHISLYEKKFRFYENKSKKIYGYKVDTTLPKTNNKLIWYMNSRDGG